MTGIFRDHGISGGRRGRDGHVVRVQLGKFPGRLAHLGAQLGRMHHFHLSPECEHVENR